MTPSIVPLQSERLRLLPVEQKHADGMYPLLKDASLYRYTGGQPPANLDAVSCWFSALESRLSADKKELWFTWILNTHEQAACIGYVQATVRESTAELAWLVGTEFQRLGYASEAVACLANWLQNDDITSLQAYIHPGHEASQKIAASVGLRKTANQVDDEDLWQS